MSDIAVTLKADTSEFETRMHQVETSLNNVNSSSRRTSDSFEGLLRSERRVENNMKGLAQELGHASSASDALANTVLRLGESFKIGLAAGIALQVGFKLYEVGKEASDAVDAVDTAFSKLNTHKLDVDKMGVHELKQQAEDAHKALEKVQELLNKGIVVKSTAVLEKGFSESGFKEIIKNYLEGGAGQAIGGVIKKGGDAILKTGEEAVKAMDKEDSALAKIEERRNKILELQIQGKDLEAEILKITDETQEKIDDAKGPKQKKELETNQADQIVNARRKAMEKLEGEIDSLLKKDEEKNKISNEKKARDTEEALKQGFKTQEDFIRLGIAQSKEADKILKAQAEGRFLDLSKKDREGAKGKKLVIDEVERQFQSAPEGSLQKQEAGNSLRKSRNELEDLIGQGSSRLGGVSSLQKIGGGGGIGSGSIDQQQLDQLKAIKDGIDKLIDQPDQTPVFQ